MSSRERFGSGADFFYKMPGADEKLLPEDAEGRDAAKRTGLRVGEQLTDQHGDAYIVKKPLGRGGMGEVYQIEQERTGLDRALKILHLDSGEENKTERAREIAQQRLQAEIRALAQLQNPFILPIIDVIECNIDSQNVLGIVMDLAEEGTLRDKMDAGTLSKQDAVTYAAEIALALASVSELGLVHRDVKPENIFLDTIAPNTMIARLADFGLAIENGTRTPSADDAIKPDHIAQRNTDPGMVAGTPVYMAPEQASGEAVTAKSDLYALGVLLYEMLAGKPPFDSKHAIFILSQKLKEDPKSFRDRGIAHIPEWLEDIVMSLIARKPQHRFDSARHVFGALKEGVKESYPELLTKEPFMWGMEVFRAIDLPNEEVK